MHPGFRGAVRRFERWPAPEGYDALVGLVPNAGGAQVPRFVTQNRQAVSRLGGYEQHVAQRRAVPTRPASWHDFFNMAVWAHFPRLRWALNALHVAPGPAPRGPRNGRAPAQNLAASFDETGMLVVSKSRSVLQGIRRVQLKRVFWQERAELAATTRFFIVGHGLLESLLAPHPQLLARSLLLHLPDVSLENADALRERCDELVAPRIEAWRTNRSVFDPVPICAIPGFWDNDAADFYDDRTRLPFEPASRRPDGSADFLG